MTPENKIEQQLKGDYDKFYEEKYSGKVPEGLILLFKKGIMAMPPFAHRINFHKVKSISQKKDKELTIGDIHEVVKVVLNTPLEKLYDDFDKAVTYQVKVDKFVVEYNSAVDEFKQKMKMKKETLLQLSGANNRRKIIA